jgi:soluble lytic murein transglycosylase-like protein
MALVDVPEPKKPEPKKPEAPAIPRPENGTIEGVSLATLDSIAACESGGDPAAVNAAGYYGKYQFDESTWASVGGTGNPAEASEAEQDYRAALLYSRAGASPWPVCGS